MSAGVFHEIPRMDDSRLAEIFAREVLLSPEWAERLLSWTFLEPEGKVGFRWGRDGAEQETMDYLEFIARVTSHIPDSGLFMNIRDHGEQPCSTQGFHECRGVDSAARPTI